MGEAHGPTSVLLTLGPVEITLSVATTWLLMAVLGLGSWLTTRGLAANGGTGLSLVESVVLTLSDAVESIAEEHTALILPFAGTLWIFLGVANLAGLVPGLDAPTADLSVTASLAVVVFGSVYWFGIRGAGVKAFFAHYLHPTPLLLPFHVLSEVTRTVALAIRLFGNIMSMETAAALVLSVAGFLAPLPILMLHIVEALVQAYIFGTLALVFIAGGLIAHNGAR